MHRGGRMGFVAPAETGYVPYCAPLEVRTSETTVSERGGVAEEVCARLRGPNSLPLSWETPMLGSRKSENTSRNAMTALKLDHLRIVLAVLAGLSVLAVFVAAII